MESPAIPGQFKVAMQQGLDIFVVIFTVIFATGITPSVCVFYVNTL